MASKSKPTKLPPRTVPSDDLVLEIDGVEFRPHGGEQVIFRSKQSVEDLLTMLRISDLKITAEDLASGQLLLDDVYGVLSRQIVSWDWTDDDGKAYVSPPDTSILRTLDFDELLWLVNASSGSRKTEEARQDDS